MDSSEQNETRQVDEETKERSAEQRNITAPTPPDVRAKGEDDDTDPSAADS
ncbi:hypothetical protein ACIRU2_18740 [Streptomyces sp. NPDC101169]|uniref:hypothetical protein n=1 Tax=unclassified Streptomyces TaxID=2593676 RepID=UPI003806A444